MSFFGAQKTEEPMIYDRVSPEFLVELIRNRGFAADVGTLQSGKPRVSFMAEGYKCSIHFYGEPVDGAYDSLQIYCGFRDKISVPKAISEGLQRFGWRIGHRNGHRHRGWCNQAIPDLTRYPCGETRCENPPPLHSPEMS
jgi:hypothetical protein